MLGSRGHAVPAAVVALACATLLGACGGDSSNDNGSPAAKSGGSSKATQVAVSPREQQDKLVVISRQDPGNWDITVTSNTFLWLWIPNNVMETLLVFDEDGKPQPKLAESWKVNDARTRYTFKLRSGVKFHNGDPLTADDVVFSLNTFRESPNAARSAPLGAVESVKALDESTVQVDLSHPSQQFFRELGGISGGVLSKRAFGQIKTKPVGTGPYEFSDYKPDSGFKLTAFPDYWGTAPKITEADVKIIPDATAALNALKAGEIDVYPFVGEETWERLDTQGFRDSYNVIVNESGQVMYVGFNTRVAPYDNQKARQAIAGALDRQAYADVFNAPWGMETTCTFATADQPWFVPADEDDCPYPFDAGSVKSNLEAAGAGDATFKVSSITDIANLGPPADILRAELQAAGVKTQNDAMAFAQFAEKVLGKGEFGVTVINTPRTIEQFNCPDPEVVPWNSYCSAKVTKLLEDADRASTEQERIDLIGQANDQILDDAVIIPILTSKNVNVLHPDLAGDAESDVMIELNLQKLSWKG
jgi:peptide/nickel transport system substrate-binding protein